MKFILIFSVLVSLALSACYSSGGEQPVETANHPVHELDSAPPDNTAVADSSNGVGTPMGGSN